ncbi:protein ENHANCED PSEUDOMONAS SUSCEPTIBILTY 1-like [Chenopodium quinoa]|uniref:protein ENHANCED PSEUDOMONAS SUSCEPTIBILTY 1-like n=1 Tax=Chenopodium quinoa TaxID=63459 RepID=UPI000B792681|nr:protein ENHANCED PSEUDOMONAS SUSCEPTIBILTY 1-like [Chenopodium quinoa]
MKLPHLEPEEFIVCADQGPLRERIFHFSPTSLANLKAKANQECETNNVISSFQALSALVWRSITRARNLPSDQPTTCSFSIGARSRFEPPLSDENFGNYIGGAQWICNVEELLGHDLGWVAMNLRKCIMAQDGKAILGMYQFFAKSPIVFTPDKQDFHGPNKVVIGGSA